MITPLQRLDNTLEAGKVIRYHAVPTVRSQTVGQHSYGVAVLALYITGGIASAALLAECLLHDSGELITGDIPFTTKRDNPALREVLHTLENNAREEHMLMPAFPLTAQDTAVLKVCDTLEGLIHCVQHEDRNGPVRNRWHEAYRVARKKFATLLNSAQWERADEVFQGYTNLNNATFHND